MTRAIVSPGNFESADVDSFVAEVLTCRFFDDDPNVEDIFVARAPGRLDLMGGIADYSGSLVLQWPLREATLVAAQRVGDGRLRAMSPGAAPLGLRACNFAIGELFPNGEPLAYEEARNFFARDGEHSWAAYVFGVVIVLAREKGWRPSSGLRLFIRSDVPEGKGVSSSAAIEVATMTAVAAAFDLTLGARELALLAQMVENRVVGAACGVMDQMTSSCGVSGQLLALLCQPAEWRGLVALPADLEIWGLDSGVRHAVSGSDYTSVRVGAFMGARILADRAGLRARPGSVAGCVVIDDTRWNGHVSNITPSELESGTLGVLPESMQGSDFLDAHGGTTDTVTRVDPHRKYAVRACTAHPIYEHFRVRTFAELLWAPCVERRSELLGELMYQSHASYSMCGLGSKETDLLVDMVRVAGPKQGFFGAKITGGGSGGTVAVLGHRGAEIGEIVRGYATRSGHVPQVFSGSSSGASAFGALRLKMGEVR